jgi:nucleotide-binding universal stress UspA family protein
MKFTQSPASFTKGEPTMHKNTDLRILFATSFSDACFRSCRAIAQIADLCGISLTIAHVAKPGSVTIATRRDLNSFLAEADHYDQCRRVLIEADDPIEALGELCDREAFDLVIAPASDRLGVQRLVRPSFRARLMRRCNAPVWTAGRCLDKTVFKPSIQTIACLLDFDNPNDTHLRLASSLAQRTGAKVRIVTVIQPTDEGTLTRSLHSRAPLMPCVATSEIQKMYAGRTCPEIEVAIGETAEELPRLLRNCDADVVFVGEGQALRGMVLPKLSSYLDRLPCPSVCIDGASANFGGWTFDQNPAVYVESRQRMVAQGQAVAS